MKTANAIGYAITVTAVLVILSAAMIVFSQQKKNASSYTKGSYSDGASMKKSLGAKTILLPVPVWMVGSYDTEGKPNMMTASWAGICCSQPPCVTVSLRKATYTYGSILKRKAFTVGIPPEKFAKEAAFAGTASGRNTDKFKACGLTPVRSEIVDAPYVKEFPLTAECKLLQTVDLGLHTMFVGEIMDVKADESILGDGGMPDAHKLKPFLYAPGNRGFYGIGEFLGDVPTLAKKE